MDVPKIPTPPGGYSGLVWSRRTGRKTGPKPTFSREDVIIAALEIGVAKFTLAEVARRIGVAPSAVYRVFDSRDELVQACLEYGAKYMDWHLPEPIAWDEALRHWGRRIWALCETYPGMDLMMLTFPGVYLHVQSAINQVIRITMEQGFTREEALQGFDTIADMVIATHIGVATMRATSADGCTALQAITEVLGKEDLYRPGETFMNYDFLEAKFDLLFDGMRVARYRRLNNDDPAAFLSEHPLLGEESNPTTHTPVPPDAVEKTTTGDAHRLKVVPAAGEHLPATGTPAGCPPSDTATPDPSQPTGKSPLV